MILNDEDIKVRTTYVSGYQKYLFFLVYFAEDYGLLNLNVVSSIGDFHRVRICLKRGADPNERCFEEDDPFVRCYRLSVII